MSRRFRGFLPVVVDFETGGFNCRTDALLEMAAVILKMDADGTLRRGDTLHCHVKPFEGANLEPAALQVTGIDPWHPLRLALAERRRAPAHLQADPRRDEGGGLQAGHPRGAQRPLRPAASSTRRSRAPA